MKNIILILVLILFCTGLSAQWEADRKLSTGEVNAQTNENMGQCIAVNGNIIHVVWTDIGNNGNGIYYKRSSDAGVTWGPDTRLTGVPSISDFPSIAVSGNFVHVAYRDSTPGLRTSNYIRSTDGGNTWGSPVSLGNYYLWPSITALGAGVYVALNSNSPGNSEVWCRRSTNNGANWEPAVQISNAAGRSEDPSIAVGGNCLHLAWNDSRTGIMQTFYRRSADLGNTWGPEIQRTNSSVFAYSPALSVTGGDVDLVWGDRRNGDYDIYHLHSPDFGSTWGTEERLSSDPASSIYPNLIRSGLNVHVIWTGNGLFYLHSDNGGNNWNSPVTLVSASSQPAMSFIAVTGTVVHVIWSDQRDGHKAIYYKRNPTGNPAVQNNTIAVSSAPSQLCTGASFPLEYVATGMFFADNVFTAQLSDGMGRFSNPIDIGTVNSSSSGEINATIPYSVTPASGYRVRVNSSSPPATGTENDFDISLNNHPTPGITGVNVACQNSSQTFSAPFFAGHSYKWTVTNGNISGLDTQRTITVNWNTSNTFGTVALKESIITTGCYDTISKKVTIVPLPLPNIQGPVITCRNNNQKFSIGASTGHSYKWSVDGGIIIGPDDSTSLEVLWATSASSGTITVIETVDGVGCTGSDKHYVDIIYVPRPSITGPNNTCNKSIQDYTTMLSSGHSFIWSIEGGSIVGANNQNNVRVSWNSSNTFGIVNLFETIDSTGCTDSTSIKVALYTAPAVTINGPITVKKGSTQNYSGPSSGITSYKWNVTGGIITGYDNLQNVSVIWGNQRTGTLRLTCTNSSGCSDSLQKNISIGNFSVLITGSESVCEQSTADYLTPFIAGRSNEWSAIGGVIVGSSTDTVVQVNWENAGNGSLTIIQTVDASQHKDTAILDITINPLPQARISGQDTVVKGRLYTYMAGYTDGTYQWEAINGTISGSSTNRIVEITWESELSGTAKVIETSKDGCIDSASLDLKLIISSVEDNSDIGNMIMKIIPNPINGKAKIEITADEVINANVQVVNSYGNVVNNIGNIILNEGTQYIDWESKGINGESIPSGIYFIKLSSKYGVVVAKAVVVR